MTDETPLVYRYRIRFADGTAVSVGVRIDPNTLELIRDPTNPAPGDWTKLAFCKCPNCPLADEENARCPAATSLTPVLGRFVGHETYEQVDVVVEAPQRTYAAQTTLGTAVASLLGLFMPTSGCPILAKLRPMADMHLPFQTRDETAVRLVSTYLAAQHLLKRAGHTPDWELGGLTDQLQQVQMVNKAFAERLSAVPEKDVAVDALKILASSADLSGRSPTERGMARLEKVVKAVFFE